MAPNDRVMSRILSWMIRMPSRRQKHPWKSLKRRGSAPREISDMRRITSLVMLPAVVATATTLRAEEKMPVLPDSEKPNVVLIFTDDQGYGDLSCYGSDTIHTPNIDSLARDGRKFTNALVPASICTPSRAGLLTGCYPKRIGMHKGVLFPNAKKGLSPEEHTIADYLKSQGYATTCIGKWHLGDRPEVLPTVNGFDSYFGIPYSNDMQHPDKKGRPKWGVEPLDECWGNPESGATAWGAPLMENEKVIELPVDQRTITRRYTQKAIDFIKENKETPFFVYLPHSMPHVPLYVPDDVRDPDPKRAYINTIEHLDAEVGRLLTTLDELDLSKETYVIYTSDNGPWLTFEHHAGSAGPFRAGKMKTYEGGHRVPCLIRGPGIPAGTVTDALFSTIDILPTIAEIVGAPLPADKKIDGIRCWRLWNGTVKEGLRNEFLYYKGFGRLEGIRQGDWKFAIRPNRQSKAEKMAGKPVPPPDVSLYNLAKDPGETNNLAEVHPEIVLKLKARMEELDAEIEENSRLPWTSDG